MSKIKEYLFFEKVKEYPPPQRISHLPCSIIDMHNKPLAPLPANSGPTCTPYNTVVFAHGILATNPIVLPPGMLPTHRCHLLQVFLQHTIVTSFLFLSLQHTVGTSSRYLCNTPLPPPPGIFKPHGCHLHQVSLQHTAPPKFSKKTQFNCPGQNMGGGRGEGWLLKQD